MKANSMSGYDGGGDHFNDCSGIDGCDCDERRYGPRGSGGGSNMRGVTVTTQKRSIVFGGCTVWLLTGIQQQVLM